VVPESRTVIPAAVARADDAAFAGPFMRRMAGILFDGNYLLQKIVYIIALRHRELHKQSNRLCRDTDHGKMR
jgi:hypothetical protein